MILLGAIIGRTGCIDFGSVETALHKVIPARKANLFDANMQDIIDDLTRVISSIKASVDAMPQTLNQTARQFAEQMQQLTASLEDSQALMNDALRRAGAPARRNGGM